MERTYKYKYVIDEKKRTIVALSTFAGQVVRGVARCAPGDKWNIEAGKKWAEARCSAKIAHKRLRRAEDLLEMATAGFENYKKLVDKYKQYEEDSINKVKAAAAKLVELDKEYK